MLGYVRINKPELKIKEYEVYRGLYCTLCRTLGREYGLMSRLLLSYDITFLVLALLGSQHIVPDFKGGRCPFNVLKKCNYCISGSELFSYAAAVTVILARHKLSDSINDSSFLKKILYFLISPFFYVKYKKAKKRYPELCEKISDFMSEQRQREQENVDIPDIAADASAKSLGCIFDRLADPHTELYDFGYFLGKWVYLMDAADDIADDLKHGNYNVFVNKYSLGSADDLTDEIKASIRETLNMNMFYLSKNGEKIDFHVLKTIVDNVIYDSIPNKTDNVLKGKNDNERSI